MATFGILRYGGYNGFNYRVNYQRENLNRRSEFRKADVSSVISPSSEQSETLETYYFIKLSDYKGLYGRAVWDLFCFLAPSLDGGQSLYDV